jgi:hypothetical protein
MPKNERDRIQFKEKSEQMATIDDQLDTLDCEYDEEYNDFGDQASDEFKRNPNKAKCLELLGKQRKLSTEMDEIIARNEPSS